MTMSQKIDRLLKVIGLQNHLLEKMIKEQRKTNSLLVSQQLLTECVGNDGSTRTAEEVADICGESFCAAMCLSEEMSEKQVEFEYQLHEFYIDGENDEEENDESNDDDDGGNRVKSGMRSF